MTGYTGACSSPGKGQPNAALEELGGGERAAWQGPEDLSAQLRFAYDEGHLYVAGRVVDDELVTGLAYDCIFDDPLNGPAAAVDDALGRFHAL